MNPQYRIYWKEKDGGRYFTDRELRFVFLSPSGRVWLREGVLPAFDITDQVVVEMWTGKEDKNGKKIYTDDNLAFDSGTLLSVRWDNDKGGWYLGDEDIEGMDVYDYKRCVVIGTVHDEQEADEQSS